MKTFLSLLILLLTFSPIAKADYTVTTIAGTGKQGFNGDDKLATTAQLLRPHGVVFDTAGHLYVTDTDNSRIRKIDTSGMITTIAGNGTEDYGGDGGPAKNAQLRGPYDIVIDSRGHLYISDFLDHRVRKIDTQGIITTVAGDGTDGYGGDNGPATNAQLSEPKGLAVDSQDNLYIADSKNHRIRKVSSDDGTVTTIAGDGTTIEDGYSMIGPIITGTYGGDGGPATAAQLNFPSDVVIDHRGNLFIADTDNHRVRQVDSAGIITTVAGTGSEDSFIYPVGLAVDSQDHLYIALLTEHRVYRLDTSGKLSVIAGNGVEGYNGDGKSALETAFQYPQGLTLDTVGNIYLADSENHRIRKLTTGDPTDNPTNGNAIGMNTKGERVSTTANFAAGVSTNGTDFLPLVTATPGQSLTFKADITVDPQHRLLESDLLLVYGTEPPPAPYTGNEDTVYMAVDSNGQESLVDLYAHVDTWMAQLDKPYTRAVTLRDTVTVKTWKKQFDTPSMYYIFVGYRIPNGTIIYVSKPIMVNVE